MNSLNPILADQLGAQVGPNLSLGELTCRLIERWDELDDGVKTEIAELVSHD